MAITSMTSDDKGNCSSAAWPRERKLLHWVNSLPPPACLLVDAPADLRFGDVLLAIVRWLQTQRQRCGLVGEQALSQSIGYGGGDSGGALMSYSSSSSTAIERLRHVLRFVAREARSEDGDAMFVVNEAQCAERVMSGATDVVCAVLRILKRVSDQLSAQMEISRELYGSNVYARAFANQRDSPLRFAKAPKTLAEVRQNLAKAFKKVSRLEHFRMPSFYLNSSTWEAVIIGDRQTTYGILWHLWQYAQELESQNRKEEASALVLSEEQQQQSQGADSDEPAANSSFLPKAGKNANAKSTKPKKKWSSKVCPLLIDIPAAVLASEKSHGKSVDLGFDYQSALSSLGVHSLWEDDHPSDHDLYPQPSAVFAASIEIESEVSLNPQQEVIPAGTAEAIVEGDSMLSATLGSSQDVSQVMEDSIPDPVPVDDASLPQEEMSSDNQRDSPRAEAEAPRKEHPIPGAMPAKDDARHAFQQTTEPTKPRHSSFSKEAACGILSWLKQLKVRLSDPAAFQVPSARLMEFQSGVLLCCIVEKVEYMRCVQGVRTKPNLTKANALHNISKALEILQQKKTMPLHLLCRKHKIYNGDRSIILELLCQIRKVRSNVNPLIRMARFVTRSLVLEWQAYGHHHNLSAHPGSRKKHSEGDISSHSELNKPPDSSHKHQKVRRAARTQLREPLPSPLEKPENDGHESQDPATTCDC